MSKILRFSVLALLLSASLLPQTTLTIDGTLSQRAWVINQHTAAATTDALTIKSSASDTNSQRVLGYIVTCSSACLITVQRGGTVATTTCAVVIAAQESSSYSYLAQACTASNAGAGTEIGHGRLAGAGPMPFGGMGLRLAANKVEQITIRVAQTSSGTIDYYVLGEFVP